MLTKIRLAKLEESVYLIVNVFTSYKFNTAASKLSGALLLYNTSGYKQRGKNS